MLIRCIKCKSQFHQKKGERICIDCPGTLKKKAKLEAKIRARYRNYDYGYRLYLNKLKKHFFDPIFQFYLEQHTEWQRTSDPSLRKS